MRPNTDPKPESGYSFRSSRRWPKAPEIIVCGPWESSDLARHKVCSVGTARIDGVTCNTWRVTDPNTGRRCYLFQTRIGE